VKSVSKIKFQTKDFSDRADYQCKPIEKQTKTTQNTPISEVATIKTEVKKSKITKLQNYTNTSTCIFPLLLE